MMAQVISMLKGQITGSYWILMHTSAKVLLQLLLELVQRTQELLCSVSAGSLNEQPTMSSSHALPHELCIVYS